VTGRIGSSAVPKVSPHVLAHTQTAAGYARNYTATFATMLQLCPLCRATATNCSSCIKETLAAGNQELQQGTSTPLHGCVQVETFRPTRPLLSGDAPMSHAGDPEAAGPPIDWGSYSFLNIKRYRQYFNVDTWVSARALRRRPGL